MTITKKALWEKCESCGHTKMLSEEIMHCDTCEKKIGDKDYFLEITVFLYVEGDYTRRFHFCCWDCVMKFIPHIKDRVDGEIDFISLPDISIDKYDNFLKAIGI